MILTHVGGPTLLIEVEGWRLLTDPTFDPPGGHYDFGWGTSSDKLAAPAIAASELPEVDAVLLTHDQHADNLDAAGRELLTDVPTVVTTAPGARRLRATGAIGLKAGETTRLRAPGRPELDVTATPARHGPPLSRPIVGEVVGFAIRKAGHREVLAWITGDTVLDRNLRRTARSLDVQVLVVHVGGVRFPITGPLRYTMTGKHAGELIGLVSPEVAVPVHYEGWSHFKDGRPELERALAGAPDRLRRRVRWLTPGEPTEVGAH